MNRRSARTYGHDDLVLDRTVVRENGSLVDQCGQFFIQKSMIGAHRTALFRLRDLRFQRNRRNISAALAFYVDERNPEL